MLAFLLGMPAAGAQAAQTTIKASAKVVKALKLTAVQDLQFGQILLPTTPGTYTVSISMSGVRTCASGLTCTGTALPAIFNLAGSNGQVVRVTTAQSDLVNAADGSKLRFTPIAPVTVTLTNSGNPGTNFNVGGSISIPSSASDGTYSGNIEVTVDYQ